MSEKDDLLIQSMLVGLESAKPGPVVIEADSTQFVRVNLLLLKALLRERNMPGVFVSVDRPHQYMAHLLRIHGIHTKGLKFMDVIGRFSADRKMEPVSLSFVDTPFHIEALPENLRVQVGEAKADPDSRSVSFVVIDNIAALLTYNSHASVEQFFRNLVAFAQSHGGVVLPIVLDKDKCGLLYETARSLSLSEISARTQPNNDPSPSGAVPRCDGHNLSIGGN